MNKLYIGDCLTILDIIPEENIDLVYIDPPFYSQKAYEIFLNNNAPRMAFEDRWKGGINTFIDYLIERIKKLYKVLKPTGSIYIHLDWHIVHYIKVEMDKIFGYHKFRNEIAWCYRTGGIPRKGYPRKHDTLLFYTKGKQFTFNPEYMPYTPGTIQRGLTKVKGKYFDKGLRKEGTPILDWWTDIQKILSPTAKEMQGYTTQKPIKLLERIIKISSDPYNIVLDAFCGCGTTLAAAERLHRNWIGIDISQTAIQLVEKRLLKLGANFETIGKAETLEELKKMPWQSFQVWAINAVFGRHSPRKIADMGIDGFTYIENNPIQVKQIESIGRPEIDKFVGVLNRVKTNKGMIVGLGFSRGAHEEVSRLKREDKKQIELIECEKLLKGEYGYNILIS